MHTENTNVERCLKDVSFEVGRMWQSLTLLLLLLLGLFSPFAGMYLQPGKTITPLWPQLRVVYAPLSTLAETSLPFVFVVYNFP